MALQAFFDESGIHGGAPATDIAGFIGTSKVWASVESEWRAYLDSKGIDAFHYWDFEERTPGTPWERMERWERDPIRAHLAHILANSALVPLNAGYRGKWDRKIVDAHYPGRYPTPYSFCFEIIIELVLQCSEDQFEGEPIAVMFGISEPNTTKALGCFSAFKDSHQWEKIISPIAFDSPNNRDALQGADMIAYECYQCLKRGTSSGYEGWPLLEALWGGANFERNPKSMYVVFHDEGSMTEVLKRPLDRLVREPND